MTQYLIVGATRIKIMPNSLFAQMQQNMRRDANTRTIKKFRASVEVIKKLKGTK